MSVLPIFYLPPISWFSEFLKADEIVLERYENFPKQTYRNRANIYGANGKLSLIIPIAHSGVRVMKDIKISYAENWQNLHWKSLKTAYQTSPYFEYYEDKIEQFYQCKEQFLLDYNLYLLEIFQSILKTNQSFALSEVYQREYGACDFRNSFSAKEKTEYQCEEYYQTFSDKLGFIEDLSIIDLICHKGPESLNYIKQILRK